METFNIERHFVILIYPFTHGFSPKNRHHRLKQVEHIWKPWWQRMDNSTMQIAMDDTYFFLPYIRTLLFPETKNLQPGEIPQWLPSITTSSLAHYVGVNDVIHLTYDPDRLQQLHPLSLELDFKDNSFTTPVHICWADIILYPQNVGFLALKVQFNTFDEQDKQPLIDVDFFTLVLYHLRLVLPPRVNWNMLQWKHDDPDTPFECTSMDLVDYLLQGLPEESRGVYSTSMHDFMDDPDHDRIAARYSSTDKAWGYGQSFRLYIYACLDETSSFDATNNADPPFDNPAQRKLYEIATCTNTEIPDYKPHPEGLRDLFELGYIAFWDNWQGMALHDNVVFFAPHATNFTRRALPHNVEGDYFFLYLLALYQKMRLNWFSGELLRKRFNLHHNLREARALWDAFVLFRNHYWFAEITFRPQGANLYRRFQKGLGALELYNAISGEVRDLQEHYESKAERRIGDLLNFITLVGLPIGLLAEVYGDSLLTPATWYEFVPVMAFVYLLVLLVWLAWRSRIGKE